MSKLVLATLAALLLLPMAAALPAAVPVAAAGFSFASPVLVVPVGTSVEWIGALLPHTVTSAASPSAALAGSPDGRFHYGLPMFASATQTFDEAGAYDYFCALHFRFGMVGTIVVTG